MWIVPFIGLISPVIRRNIVDFPAPFWPIRVILVFFLIEKLASSRSSFFSVWPYVTSSNLRITSFCSLICIGLWREYSLFCGFVNVIMGWFCNLTLGFFRGNIGV